MSGVQAPRVLLLALAPGRGRRDSVIDMAAHFLDEGAEVELVTAKRGWDELDERARLHQLHELEAKHPLTWLENAVVIRAPRVVFLPTRLLGRPGRKLDRVRSKSSKWVHRKLYLPVYKHIRPLLLARIARRRVMPGIDMTGVVRVIVADRWGVPLGWRLARRHPDVPVTMRMDKTLDGRA
ncbi:hypothetical protein BZB76_6657 [Actinomadura pelletieri DSM 43383]|uniref:Uncharacterized protein n=1 Tax=Actinomadura pelletieri DSM 43383 TaxID=1120940 RepID=A0A495QA82_9ACTN|nr:hypothetical protein [Actinomadura pelletieri]RKS68393.1 hypothetical protein BZB76_6657 [Actinomadura pelletieri DSM 43383]